MAEKYRYKFELVAYYDKKEQLWDILEDVAMTVITMCKYCGSTDCVRFGTYKGVRRWGCKDCKRKFVANKALPKMRTPVHQVASALSMYYGGMPLDAISRHLEQHYDNPVTDAGIYKWIIRFSNHAVYTARQYTPKVGDVWVADETVLKIGGKDSREGRRGRDVYFWDIIDAKTRFLLASHISRSRTTKDALTLMKLAKQRAGKAPRVILTDKLQAYEDGIELVFGADTTHTKSKGFIAPENTNLIERFQGTLKDRTAVMRGFRDVATARKILEGWLVHYNHFRPHESLGNETPAEKAGTGFPYKDWEDVVRGSAKALSWRKGNGKPLPKTSPSHTIPFTHTARSKPKGRKPRVQTTSGLSAIRR